MRVRIREAVALRQPPAGPEAVFLGIGGNTGDRLHYLNRGVRLLDRHPRINVDDVSSVYETAPIGPSDDPYLNIAVRVLTDLAPLPLLRACQRVEATLGRVRSTRWGARTIDVDVLLYGDRQLTADVLTVPHPELANRAFALVPLTEVAPGWRLPDGRSLAKAIADLAPLEGITAIGRQVSVEPLPSGPPDLAIGTP
ncbi:2-amino-4-hydroxy-6-hydroxymethyldihydropteridine diphosphokinase [Euzebya sp.]|uniref:2-amino-4-hydroxy-6- hydroxymethyldihydropteridine diphosphokinase n=1 Tax=Euzebya sp. TaxID=1971409 RepID=UPI003511505B